MKGNFCRTGEYRLLCFPAFLLDLTAKWAARYGLAGNSVSLALGFRLELHVNPGVAFGLSPTLGWAVGLLGLAILPGLTWAWGGRGHRANCGLGLLWAGGLSNVLERLFLGGVTDFLLVPLPRLPFVPLSGVYINLADLWLFLGMLLLAVDRFGTQKAEGACPPPIQTRPML